MATRYTKLLLAIAPLTLPTILMGMQPTAQTASMQVIQSAPHMQVVSETIPVQPDGKEAAPQHGRFVEEKEGEALFKKIDELNTQMASYISTRATKTSAIAAKNEDLEEWQHIDRQELLAELAKLKAENKRLLEENSRSKLARLTDMLTGAAVLTITEIAAICIFYHEEIRYIYNHRKELSAIWDALFGLIYGS